MQVVQERARIPPPSLDVEQSNSTRQGVNVPKSNGVVGSGDPLLCKEVE